MPLNKCFKSSDFRLSLYHAKIPGRANGLFYFSRRKISDCAFRQQV